MSDRDRFRERAIAQLPSFYGNTKGIKLKAGGKIGTIFEYRSNGTTLSATDKLLTGTPNDSLSRERTWDTLHDPPYLKGGPFKNVKVTLPAGRQVWRGRYPGNTRREYVGAFQPFITNVGPQYSEFATYGGPNLIAFPSTSPYHNKAWDLLRPKLERAGFAQFVYELKDLPGMLRTSAKGFREAWLSLGGRDGIPIMQPKSVADHFLNHQFGWVPFINDLLKFYDTYENSRKYLDRMVQNNGQFVKRRVMVDSTFSVSPLQLIAGPSVEPSGFDMDEFVSKQTVNGSLSNGLTYTESVVKTDVWAVGSFRYYRPELDSTLKGFSSSWSNTKRLLLLYGARINPEVLWKITPWSWLVDWFFSLGRNISIANAWAYDAVVAKYAYIMLHQTQDIRQTGTMFFKNGARVYSLNRTLETKQRVDAGSPYGFSLNWSNLTPTQYAILGAIGITRSNFG
jgi:hypothetical protein